MPEAKQQSRFGFDAATGKLRLGRWRIAMPQSRPARIAIGGGLVCGGILGFLPILGFWMVPLGVLVLSQDIAIARRLRRRFSVWWARRRNGGNS